MGDLIPFLKTLAVEKGSQSLTVKGLGKFAILKIGTTVDGY
jgi:hypothetical protein